MSQCAAAIGPGGAALWRCAHPRQHGRTFPTGHDRPAAIRRFGAAARAHPASWELALRLQLAAIAREAWLLGRGIEPVACFSDGRTFRLAVRLRKRAAAREEAQLGLLARCERCGDQAVQSLLKLSGWRPCACEDGSGRWAVTGRSGPVHCSRRSCCKRCST